MKSTVAILVCLLAGVAAGGELPAGWRGTLWRASDYHGFAMQANWQAALAETGHQPAAATPHKSVKAGKKPTGAVAGNPTGKRVHRKTPVDDGMIPPNVVVPPR